MPLIALLVPRWLGTARVVGRVKQPWQAGREDEHVCVPGC